MIRLAALLLAASTVTLPQPSASGPMNVERALALRRSVREFAPAPIAVADLAQLLWAAQGITSADGRRTAPSAGALYPLELYVIAGNVDGLQPGVYHYDASRRTLDLRAAGDRRAALSRAALGQPSVGRAPASIVIAAAVARTAVKYGTRAERYCAIEAGCASQNVALQAVARGLGTVVVGAFDDARVREVALMQRGETPLIIMPVGKPLTR